MKPILLYSRTWRSGTALYAHGVARGLLANGCAVEFISPLGETEDPTAVVPGLTRIRPPRELTGDEPRSKRAIASLKRVLGALGALLLARLRTDRFVINIPDPLVFFLGPLAMLRLTGAKVVYVCHDPRPHAWRLPESLRWLERAGYAALYRLSWRIVVLARAGKRVLVEDLGVPAEKIVVIPHGALEAAPAGPVPGSGVLLLFGMIRRNKNILQAIEAVAEARGRGQDVRLLVAGAAHPEDMDYLAECRALAERLPEAVELQIGYVPDGALDGLIQRSDALVLPYSDFDSQSGVAVLAGIAGRPVIATRAGGLEDLIEDGLAAEVIETPLTTETLAAAVERFYATPAQTWSVRAAEGREKLRVALAWETIGARFEGLFA